MEKLKTFEEFLATQSVQLPVWDFVINLMIAAALAFLLGKVYGKYGTALSNRKQFAGNFMLLAMTTMLIISVVKSSIALSLGLVGALSIVRFRAAIKEPEELVYLFLTIGIGLGLGADQRLVTVVSFGIILGVIWLRYRAIAGDDTQNLYLTIGSSGERRIELRDIVDILKRHCVAVDMKRFDESKDRLEAAFQVSFAGFAALEASKAELRGLNEAVSIAFLDHRGIGGLE